MDRTTRWRRAALTTAAAVLPAAATTTGWTGTAQAATVPAVPGVAPTTTAAPLPGPTAAPAAAVVGGSIAAAAACDTSDARAVTSAQIYWTDLNGIHTEKGSVGYVESIYSPRCRTIKGHAHINAPYPDGSGVLRVEIHARDGVPPTRPDIVDYCTSQGVNPPDCYTPFIDDNGYRATASAEYDNTYGDHQSYIGETYDY